MDPDKNEQSKSKPIDVKGASARTRTQSEAPVSDDGNSSESNARQRTTSQTFLIASDLTAASPPKFVTLEEIMQAANGMKDMALVHQIVVDKDFKLERFEPEPNTLQGVVKDTMHKAFWDLLKQQLSEDPPNYTQALILLDDIKNGLFSVLLPQHTKIKQQISEVLDSDLIRQQAEKGVIDFHHYAQYVTSVMFKLCAPVRDEDIKKLSEETDVIETFKGILKFLDLMVLDMANFTIKMVKPEIIAHSVELERNKFAEILAVQTDGLEHTRKWILRHVDTSVPVPPGDETIPYIKNITKQAFTEGCIDLLEWDDHFPETFMLDQLRIIDLQTRTNRLIIIGTLLLITISNVGPDLQSIAAFKQSLKEHISVLLQTLKTDKDLEESLPNVVEQIINDIKEAENTFNLHKVNENTIHMLREQLFQIVKPDNRIRQLVRQRVKEFFFQIIESSTADPQKVPSGLTALQKELTGIAGQFLGIVAHNSTVFCIYYFDIVEAALLKST